MRTTTTSRTTPHPPEVVGTTNSMLYAEEGELRQNTTPLPTPTDFEAFHPAEITRRNPRIVMNIISTRVPSVEEVVRGLELPVLEGIAKKTAERIAGHNKSAADLSSYITNMATAVAVAVQGVGDDTADVLDLGSALENRRFAKSDGYSRACKLWRQRFEIASAMVADLSPAVAAAEKQHAAAVVKAVELLAKAGLTEREMPAAAVNERTAKTQLEAIVRQCRPVRTTAAEIVNAKARLDAARLHVATSKNGEAAAKSATRAMAAHMAAAI